MCVFEDKARLLFLLFLLILESIFSGINTIWWSFNISIHKNYWPALIAQATVEIKALVLKILFSLEDIISKLADI